MTRAPNVNRGDAITADWANRTADAANLAASVSSGPGIDVTRQGNGLSISLAAHPSKYELAGIITAAPDGDDIPIEEAIYSAQVIGSEAVITDVVPTYGRLFANGVRVKPARVGHYCRIVRVPKIEDGVVRHTADLWILSEQVLTRRCGTGANPGGGTTPPGGGTDPPDEPPPTPPPVPGPPDSTPPPSGGEQ